MMLVYSVLFIIRTCLSNLEEKFLLEKCPKRFSSHTYTRLKNENLCPLVVLLVSQTVVTNTCQLLHKCGSTHSPIIRHEGNVDFPFCLQVWCKSRTLLAMRNRRETIIVQLLVFNEWQVSLECVFHFCCCIICRLSWSINGHLVMVASNSHR